MMATRTRALDHYQVDAFAERVFTGNPAAVVLLNAWPDDAVLAAIAAEHNLAETAFVRPGDDAHGPHELRWFTPTCEVVLCGHATLATAHVLLHCRTGFAAPLTFATRHSGTLGVAAEGDLLWLDFPAQPIAPAEPLPALVTALGATPVDWHVGPNHLAVLDTAAAVDTLAPDLAALAGLAAEDDRGLIVTARAEDGVHDFVSRYFAPHHGVDEDAVTGSAHCMLAPYWAGVLGRDTLSGRQRSARGGTVACRVRGDRVHLGGRAVCYSEGVIHVPAEAFDR